MSQPANIHYLFSSPPDLLKMPSMEKTKNLHRWEEKECTQVVPHHLTVLIEWVYMKSVIRDIYPRKLFDYFP